MQRRCAVRSRAREGPSGLTLIEFLVGIAILGVLATGIARSVQALLAHAGSEDVEARLRASWQLAKASAYIISKNVRRSGLDMARNGV